MNGDEVRFINIEWVFSRIFNFFHNLFYGGRNVRGNIDGNLNVDTGTEGGIFANSRIGIFFSDIGSFIALFVKVIAPILIILLIIAYIYYVLKIRELKHIEKQKMLAKIYEMQQEGKQKPENTRWQRVESLFHSDQASDWRVAIIEADAMLEDLLVQLGYEGESVGERLKNVDPGNFPGLRDAWDAHIVRNRIAHDGMDFYLDPVEKNRVFHLYEKVFMGANFI